MKTIKNLVILITLLFLNPFSLIKAQSLIDDRDESIYFKGNSKVYIGVDQQEYVYSIKRTYVTFPNGDSATTARTYIDTTTNTIKFADTYRYYWNSSIMQVVNKIETYDLYIPSTNAYSIMRGWQIYRDDFNNRIGFESYYHKDSLNLDSLNKNYDRYVYTYDNYSFQGNRIVEVRQKTIDYYKKPYTGGDIIPNNNYITNIVWLDYENEIKKTYDIRTDVGFNRVFFNYKDSFGSYDKTERKNIAGFWYGVKRETRNFDANGINSVTLSDSTASGWVVNSKTSFTYYNGKLATITKVLSTDGIITYTEQEIFIDVPITNLRKKAAKELLVLDDRDIEESITGVQDNSKEGKVSIFPNPGTSGNVNIVGLNSGDKTIKFINNQGIVIHTEKTDKTTIHLDNQLSPGLYSIQVVETDKIYSLENLIIL